MANRREFSDEYKREAVRMATQLGVKKSQIADELGINANLLGRWCKDYLTNGGSAFPGHGKSRDEEMASLKRELARVKKERDFSREAATFFARESK
jgi:transposase